jgi:hypothetical protein
MIVAWKLSVASIYASICQELRKIPYRDDTFQLCSYVSDRRGTYHWNLLKISTDMGTVTRTNGAKDR